MSELRRMMHIPEERSAGIGTLIRGQAGPFDISKSETYRVPLNLIQKAEDVHSNNLNSCLPALKSKQRAYEFVRCPACLGGELRIFRSGGQQAYVEEIGDDEMSCPCQTKLARAICCARSSGEPAVVPRMSFPPPSMTYMAFGSALPACRRRYCSTCCGTLGMKAWPIKGCGAVTHAPPKA